MPTPLQSHVPKKLTHGRQCFEKWRRTHKPRSRLPEHLWTLAAELAQEYGLNRTARTLRLDYHGLKKRMELPISGEVSSALPPSAFLELRPTEAHSSVACTIECEAGQGGRMRIHLQGHELPDLAALIGSFWSRQR